MADETARARAEIDQTREELGDTAQALAQELDPRVRARRAADDARSRARARLEPAMRLVRENPGPAVGAAAGVLLVLGRRRRRRRRR